MHHVEYTYGIEKRFTVAKISSKVFWKLFTAFLYKEQAIEMTKTIARSEFGLSEDRFFNFYFQTSAMSVNS